MLTLLLGELVSETVIHAHDLRQKYQFYLAFLSGSLGHGEHGHCLLLEVYICFTALKFDENSTIGLKLEISQVLLLVEAALCIESAVNTG